MMIRAEAARLLRDGSPAPVIAAGSTGSVPATAELLAGDRASLRTAPSCSRASTRGSTQESWAGRSASSEREPAGAGHPQYGLKLLLEGFGVSREAVERLGSASESALARDRFVSEAMRPASHDGALERRCGASARREARGRRRDRHRRGGERAGGGARRRGAPARSRRDRGADRRARHAGPRACAPRRRRAQALGDRRRRFRRPPARPHAAPEFSRGLVAETALGGAEAETLLALLKHPLAAFGGTPRTDASRGAEPGARGPARSAPASPASRRFVIALTAAARAMAAARGRDSRRTSEDGRARSFSVRLGRCGRSRGARRGGAGAARSAFVGQRRGCASRRSSRRILRRSSRPRCAGRAALFADEAGEALALALREPRGERARRPERSCRANIRRSSPP